jgi:hypothetical protein
MNENDRKRRLDDASDFHDALNSLGKVNETHRIGFVHDRLMSAIDDICKVHQGGGPSKFTASQILILKDIVFQVVYVLDPKNRSTKGFFRRLLVDWKEQSPLKQISLAAATVVFVAAAIAGVVQATDTWLKPTLQYFKIIHVEEPPKAAGATSPAAPQLQTTQQAPVPAQPPKIPPK